MSLAQTESTPATYGCEKLGRLRRVMLHRPFESLRLVNPGNCARWLFDAVPHPDRFVHEHDRYRSLLESLGIEVIELMDCLPPGDMRPSRLPNLCYLHDSSVICSRGALLSRMSTDARRGEEHVVLDALKALGIPIVHSFQDPNDAFEGCLLVSPDMLLVANTERHNVQAVNRFIPEALSHFREVIRVELPQARRFMHPDMIFNRIREDLALAYPPAFLSTTLHTREGAREIDFANHLARRGMEVIAVSDAEQRRWGCSFVPIAPGVIVHYDIALEPGTRRALEGRGVEFVFFHPEALLPGGGSLRCLTLRLHREAD